MAAPVPDLREIGLEGPRLAVEIYLRIAYPDGTWPEAVRRRLAWPEGITLSELLEQKTFERSQAMTAGGGAIYALRLGNRSYPHMKLQIQPWPAGPGYPRGPGLLRPAGIWPACGPARPVSSKARMGRCDNSAGVRC